jgi:outer membrane protein assembly factor BamB
MPRFYILILAFSVLLARAENWPCFRGPTRQGESSETGLPIEWSEFSNILWKATVPGEAWSSPIVWEDNVLVTTATDGGTHCHVICFDRPNGRILWARQVLEQAPLHKEGKNSYATPTPVTDGAAVFAVFGDGSLVALSSVGQVLWQNRDVKFYSQHGLGASPILHDDLLIMPYDGSSQEGDKTVGWQKPWEKSFLLALDKRTGKPRWKGERGPSRIAHVTPNIFKQDGKEYLVSGAGDVVQGFELATGKRLWSVTSKGEGVVPSIVIGGNLIYSASGFGDPAIRAVVPPAREGEEPKIAWEQKKGVPSLSSFVYKKPYLFAITDGGIASCLKADTGEIVWTERVGGKHSASPVVAENRIYFLSEEGETTVIEAGPHYKVIARNKLGGPVQASMALSHKQLFIRSGQHLYCIGKP